MLTEGVFHFGRLTVAPCMPAGALEELEAVRRLGAACQKTLGRRVYRFDWGSICSCMDIKTGECLIRVEYDSICL